MKRISYKCVIVLAIIAACHAIWHQVRELDMKKQFLQPVELPLISNIKVGDPVSININGMVKYRDEDGLVVVEYKNNMGIINEMIFHIPYVR